MTEPLEEEIERLREGIRKHLAQCNCVGSGFQCDLCYALKLLLVEPKRPASTFQLPKGRLIQ